MPLTLFDRSWSERLTQAQFWAYRIGISTALLVLDDPAWLALMFC